MDFFSLIYTLLWRLGGIFILLFAIFRMLAYGIEVVLTKMEHTAEG